MAPRPHQRHCIDGETEVRAQLDWSLWSCAVHWVESCEGDGCFPAEVPIITVGRSSGTYPAQATPRALGGPSTGLRQSDCQSVRFPQRPGLCSAVPPASQAGAGEQVWGSASGQERALLLSPPRLLAPSPEPNPALTNGETEAQRREGARQGHPVSWRQRGGLLARSTSARNARIVAL